jgi:ABC-type branched-subunit amino acid transport system ATPase component
VTTAALSTRALEKRFGSLAVASDINLTIPKGVRYALIGLGTNRSARSWPPGPYRHGTAKSMW